MAPRPEEAGGGAGEAASAPPRGLGPEMAAVLAGGSGRAVWEAARRSAVRPPAPGGWGCAPAGTAGRAAGMGGGMAGQGAGLPVGWGATGGVQLPAGPAAAAGSVPDGSCSSCAGAALGAGVAAGCAAVCPGRGAPRGESASQNR